MINFRVNRTKKDRLQLKRLCVNMLGGKCIDCGYCAHLAALDFDHVNPKTKLATVGSLLCNQPWYLIKEEVAKCVLRCANCHRIKTWPDATN